MLAKQSSNLDNTNPNRMTIVPTGLDGLDTILGGGIPVGSLLMLVGAPGSGKTTLLQQLCFAWTNRETQPQLDNSNSTETEPNFETVQPQTQEVAVGADTEIKIARKIIPAKTQGRPLPTKALYFSTLSEPHDKVIQHMSQLDFFDQAKIGNSVKLFSLTDILATKSAKEVSALIVRSVRQENAGLVTVDGLGALFDAFENHNQARYFLNQLSAQLHALGVIAIMSLEQALFKCS